MVEVITDLSTQKPKELTDELFREILAKHLPSEIYKGMRTQVRLRVFEVLKDHAMSREEAAFSIEYILWVAEGEERQAVIPESSAEAVFRKILEEASKGFQYAKGKPDIAKRAESDFKILEPFEYTRARFQEIIQRAVEVQRNLNDGQPQPIVFEEGPNDIMSRKRAYEVLKVLLKEASKNFKIGKGRKEISDRLDQAFNRLKPASYTIAHLEAIVARSVETQKKINEVRSQPYILENRRNKQVREARTAAVG